MASWMIHLRIADKLLDKIPDLSPIEFIMGNMAPDSGVPNEDGTAFIPDKSVSHYRRGSGQMDVDAYICDYFTPEKRAGYDDAQFSFYLGYLTHLIADVFWHQQIFTPCKERCIREFEEDKAGFIARVKADWYDQDFLYLQNRPGFRAFRAYLGSVGFVNRYLDFFAPDAFDNRREYITDFYLQPHEGLDREYPYLTQADADTFVDNAVAEILARLEEML